MTKKLPDLAFTSSPGIEYPEQPFHPPQIYSEYCGSWLDGAPTNSENEVYPLVREAIFRALGGYDPTTGRIDQTELGP
jgi:hypothetical protein